MCSSDLRRLIISRLLAELAQVREMMSLRHLGDQLDRYALMMAGLPPRIDQMLTLGSEGGTRLKLRVPETALHHQRKNSAAVVTALLLVLAAAVLLPSVTASLVSKEWANRINTVVFIAVGAMVLRAAAKV